MNLVLVAAVALIDADGRVLLAQRPEGKQLAGLWEFPGGKVEPGETPEETLIRELDEEGLASPFSRDISPVKRPTPTPEPTPEPTPTPTPGGDTGTTE